MVQKIDNLDDFADLASVPPHRSCRNHPFLERLRKAIEFDFVSISGLDIDGFRLGSGQSLDTNAPPAFVEAYFADGLYKSDPVVLALATSKCVVIEQKIYETNPPPRRLAYLTELFNFRNRTVFPLRRGSLTYASVCFTRSEPFDADEIAFLEHIAPAVYSVITAPIAERFASESLKLSTGQITCLKLASEGLTSEDIGANSGYQTETVNSYIKAATKKLGARNRTHAIAEALRQNIIE